MTMSMSIAEARDILDRYALSGRLDVELIQALHVASRVLDNVLHADVEQYREPTDEPPRTARLAG